MESNMPMKWQNKHEKRTLIPRWAASAFQRMKFEKNLLHSQSAPKHIETPWNRKAPNETKIFV